MAGVKREEFRAPRPSGPAWSSDLTRRAGVAFKAMFLITIESQKQTLCSVENQSTQSSKDCKNKVLKVLTL